MKTYLIDALKNLGTETETRLPNLNHGGCGTYASLVAQRLNRLGIPTWGRAMGHDGGNINAIRDNNGLDVRRWTARQWSAQGVNFWHVYTQFFFNDALWIHDSTDTCIVNSALARRIQPGTFSLKELLTMGACDEGWNLSFKRDTGIPIIKETIDKFITPELVCFEQPAAQETLASENETLLKIWGENIVAKASGM